jgi:hypothetical protein
MRNVHKISDEKGIKQERQGTYNVTLRRVRVAIVTVEKQEALHFLNMGV